MRHHPQDVAALVGDPGDVVQGAVRVFLGVAENDLVVVFQFLQSCFISVEGAISVGDWQVDLFAPLVFGSKDRVVVDYFQFNGLADELQRVVSLQGAWQKAGFSQDLEAIAGSKDWLAFVGHLDDGGHDVGKAGNRACSQVVPVGEAAWQHYGIKAVQAAFL